ncbi:hypothetical protein B6V75_18235 [Thioclava sp. F1Mire-8]|uniref:glycosyltransferase family 4 protein n=1 Tax=Thioclava sp. F1Mire-8 TaxID=1973006 RepID=UPI000B545269|nr:glycosyltransferase family 4 protein [Thioclava sp. F1Mire-8]OWX99685.1 hypothetical protein B6V75_18235 [Thioclava sp. F1Mire-8]
MVEVHDAKVLVVQHGGRRQYAIPAALARRGRLEAFYTDMCIGRGPGRLLTPLKKVSRSVRQMDLSVRTPPPEVLQKTHVFTSWFLEMKRALDRSESDPERVRRIFFAHKNASKKMARRGFGAATHLLVQLGEGIDLQVAAKKKGLTTVTDVNIAPSVERIVRQEKLSNPHWDTSYMESPQPLTNFNLHSVMESVVGATDIFLCPSHFVRDDLVHNFGVDPVKIRLLPYAVNPKWLSITPNPVKGRVFFAGKADLRKGIHTLSAAADILNKRGRAYDFFVAGSASEAVQKNTIPPNVRYLGRKNTTEMRKLFSEADVFAFPSLVEGSAGVTYEAIGAGVPVVTTFESGSVIRDGVEGRLIESRSPTALANAIEEIIEDREKRRRMSEAARLLAQSMDWKMFEERLFQCLFS